MRIGSFIGKSQSFGQGPKIGSASVQTDENSTTYKLKDLRNAGHSITADPQATQAVKLVGEIRSDIALLSKMDEQPMDAGLGKGMVALSMTVDQAGPNFNQSRPVIGDVKGQHDKEAIFHHKTKKAVHYRQKSLSPNGLGSFERSYRTDKLGRQHYAETSAFGPSREVVIDPKSGTVTVIEGKSRSLSSRQMVPRKPQTTAKTKKKGRKKAPRGPKIDVPAFPFPLTYADMFPAKITLPR